MDMDDRPLIERVNGEDREATVRGFVVNALALASGEQMSGEEKMHRYELAMRLRKGGIQEISSEEVALIKKVVGTLYAPLIVGQVFQWAENKYHE